MKHRARAVLKIFLVLPAILFIVSGLRWWVDPSGAAAQLGMPLLDGVGLSSQIGDLAAFFLVLGLFVLTGVVTAERRWFYAPVALLVLAAVSRLLAWVIHDASLAVALIAVEVVVAALLWFSLPWVCNPSES